MSDTPAITSAQPIEAVTYVCRTCGSEDVSQDAWADWSPAKSDMELRSSFDDSYCHECQDSCKIDEVRITDLQRLESIRKERLRIRIENQASELHALVEHALRICDATYPEYPDGQASGADVVQFLTEDFEPKARALMAKIDARAPSK